MTATQTERNRRWLEKRPDYFADWYARHPGYRSWRAMRDRCTNPNSPNWAYYGGRGITVCARWDDYETFMADMGQRPSPDHTLDRLDPDKDYEPGNVRWATASEQQRNKRHSVPPAVLDRIRSELAAGNTLRGTAAALNADGIQAPRGGRWYGVTVKLAAVRAALDSDQAPTQ